MDSDFDNVTWSTEANSPNEHLDNREDSSIPPLNGNRSQSVPQARPKADAVDLAGIGSGYLECEVGSPLKENDGTKDAFVSYLVTTNVGSLRGSFSQDLMILDRLQILPKTNLLCPSPLHRFRISLQKSL